MKILFADDTRGLLELLENRADLKEHNIDGVFDGTKALELIKSDNYDLVFVDYNMPGVDGADLIKYAKANNLRAKMVMITGDPDMDYFSAKTLGVDEYLAKPIKIEMVENIINKYTLKDG
ncbi:MAG TPA: response regulator [Candidatus Omnitrophica bacterium]|nr:response regulator [Candidatus Omnitrophota bacterium]